MELRELRVRHAQPHGRDVPGERLDARPVEEAARLDAGRRARAASRRRTRPRRPTSTPTTRYQPSSRASSISFARTSRAPSTLISCRSSTSFRSSTSCGRPLERLQVEPLGVSVTRPGAISAICSAGDEHLPAGDRREDAGHRRVVVVAEPDDQVVDPPEPLARRVAQLAADDEREVDHRRRSRGHLRSPSCITASACSGRSRACRRPSRASARARRQNAAPLLKPGKSTFIPKKPVMNVSGGQHDDEDREDVEDVVLLVRDHRLVRVLERLDDLLVVVEQVPDPLGSRRRCRRSRARGPRAGTARSARSSSRSVGRCGLMILR